MIIRVLLCLFIFLNDLQARQVLSVTGSSGEDSGKIVVALKNKINYTIFKMRSPNRVVVDLEDVVLADDSEVFLSGDGIVRRIRHAKRGANNLRLVLDTRGPVSFSHGFKSPTDNKIVNLVLNVTRSSLPSSNVIAKHKKKFVVAIDAGHGGEDSGAIGPAGTFEKEITLDIAFRLNNIIAQNSRINGVLTRAEDRRVGLRNRVSVARTKGADLFLSIHADAIENRSVMGSSVYVLSNRGASSELARRLASQANAADFIGSIQREDKADDLWETLVDLSQKAASEESSRVAKTILLELNKIGRVHKKQVQHAGFMVLKALDIPSVLIEVAFISNPHEEKRLSDPVFREKVAKAIYRGICVFFKVPYADSHRSTDKKYVVKRGDTLSVIAYRQGTSVRELKKVNNLVSDSIREGQSLVIP